MPPPQRSKIPSHYTPSQYPDFFISSQYLSLYAIIFYMSLLFLSLFPLAASSAKAGIEAAFTFECLEPTVHCTKLLVSIVSDQMDEHFYLCISS